MDGLLVVAWLIFPNYALPYDNMEKCLTAKMQYQEDSSRAGIYCINGNRPENMNDMVKFKAQEQTITTIKK